MVRIRRQPKWLVEGGRDGRLGGPATFETRGAQVNGVRLLAATLAYPVELAEDETHHNGF